ncbi:MAG: PilZ domain-containing protein [Candidatus Acidiferrales bacterium]
MAKRDRRTARRFRMKLPISLTWTSGKARGEVRGETSEVSSRGVHFFADSDMPSGTPVEFQMTLPHEVTMAGPVRVRCLGRVVRTEPREENRVGVAVAIERYEFLRSNDQNESAA